MLGIDVDEHCFTLWNAIKNFDSHLPQRNCDEGFEAFKTEWSLEIASPNREFLDSVEELLSAGGPETIPNTPMLWCDQNDLIQSLRHFAVVELSCLEFSVTPITDCKQRAKGGRGSGRQR